MKRYIQYTIFVDACSCFAFSIWRSEVRGRGGGWEEGTGTGRRNRGRTELCINEEGANGKQPTRGIRDIITRIGRTIDISIQNREPTISSDTKPQSGRSPARPYHKGHNTMVPNKKTEF